MCYQSVTAVAAPAKVPPLHCLIVDDEPQAATALAACAQQVPALALVGTCTSPGQALAFLQKQAVEVLFLSVELPLLAGLALLRTQGTGPAVVLTSQYPDYNLQDYSSYGVVDYLLKPVHFARFQQLAARLTEQREAWQRPAPASSFFAQPPTDSLYFWVSQQLVQVPLAEVLYLEDLGGRSRVQTQQQALITDIPFATLADQLPEPRFLHVNAAFVVALHQATPLTGNLLAVGDRHISVGAALRDEVLARAFQTRLWGA